MTAVVLAAAGAAAVYAWRSEIAPIEAQNPQAVSPELVSRGANLALIGNCNTCHTKENGPAFAGGRAIPTPFGTIYASNITPDPDTGIGRWSEPAFQRAMHEGVRRDGAHLYPAFPYDHFTKASADDVRAIYAFLMSREPVSAETPANELAFPFSVRPLIAGWKLLYFSQGEFVADDRQSADWNRGAYLAEGLAHCGACHTPRNALGAMISERHLAGGEAEGWHAPALNADSPAPMPWTSEQLKAYLRHGYVAPHGVAAGPMQPVVNNLGQAQEDDVNAIASYVGSILEPATANRAHTAEAETVGRSAATGGPNRSAEGAAIYAGACAACHEQSGQSFSAHGIPIGASNLVAMPDPRNLINVIENGIAAPDGAPAATMPGFANALTEPQVVALASFLRSRFADKAAWTNLEDAVRELRAERRH